MSKAEEQIRRAIEDGKFEDLPGKGKPLNLEQNPFEDPEWRLAHQVLRNSGFSLPWIERRREIESLIDTARISLKRAWVWQSQARLQEIYSSKLLDEEWSRAVNEFRERVEEINRQIVIFNLEAPTLQVQLRVISADRELELTSSPPSDTLPD